MPRERADRIMPGVRSPDASEELAGLTVYVQRVGAVLIAVLEELPNRVICARSFDELLLAIRREVRRVD